MAQRMFLIILALILLGQATAHGKCLQPKIRCPASNTSMCVNKLLATGNQAQAVLNNMLDSNCFGFKEFSNHATKTPTSPSKTFNVATDCIACKNILGDHFYSYYLEHHGAHVYAQHKSALQTIKVHYEHGKTKGKARALMKATCKYGGKVENLTDVARATISAENSASLWLALTLFDWAGIRPPRPEGSETGTWGHPDLAMGRTHTCQTEKYGKVSWEIVGYKNRFAPRDEGANPYDSGYHDILTNIRIKSIQRDPSPSVVNHILEVQFHHQIFYNLKSRKDPDTQLSGHDYYNVLRVLDENRLCNDPKGDWGDCVITCPCHPSDCKVWETMGATPKVMQSVLLLKENFPMLHSRRDGTMNARDIARNVKARTVGSANDKKTVLEHLFAQSRAIYSHHDSRYFRRVEKSLRNFKLNTYTPCK